MLESFTVPLMSFLANSGLRLIIPELFLVVMILMCVLHLAFSNSKEARQQVWLYAVMAAFGALAILLSYWPLYQTVGLMSFDVAKGMFRADLFSLLIRTLLAAGTLIVLAFTRTYINEKAGVPGEFYVILLSALLGGMMLSGATDLIMVFVALETLSISSYVLAGYMRGNVLSAEAGLKYLLYGGMATAILLFGFSILYGLTGYTGYAEIASHLSLNGIHPLIVAIMAITIVGGLAFKLSAAPFHMWAPDTYEGAPTPVVAFLSVVSKIAAFAFAIRLFSLLFGSLEGWTGLISTLAVVSMVVGNVVALAQKNIKRLLAYSTVAHVGYLLLGMVVMNEAGLSSLVYYLMTYLFMNLGAFAIVTHVENLTGSTRIADYAGLGRKAPLLTLVLTVMLLSLAGIPITAGFFGKFFLFQALVSADQHYLWLVVVALLTSTVSLYYYLNVIRLMVIAEPSEAVAALPDHTEREGVSFPMGLTLMVCLFATLGLGIFSESFLALSGRAVHEFAKPATAMPQQAQHLQPAQAVLSQAR